MSLSYEVSKRSIDDKGDFRVRDFFLSGVTDFMSIIADSEKSIDESLADAFHEFKTNVLSSDEW